MRIGIDIRALMEGKTTGVQVYIVNLLEALFAQDTQNQYLLFANSSQPVSKEVQKFSHSNVQYRIFRYSNKVFNFCQKFFHFPKIDKLLGGIDLFFSPHWRLVSLSSGIPLIATFHDLSFEIFPEFFTWRQRLWHKFMNYQKAATRADFLVAVSESTKQDLIRFYNIPPQKIRVIHSGVSLVKEAEPVANLPEKYFLFFSTFEPRKNLEAVLIAYQKYCQRSQVKTPLVLAGSFGWKTKLEIPAEIRKSVTVLHNVNEGQKTFLYEHAWTLLFLSFYEGFGFPVLEAASKGVPVIASFAPSLVEIGSDFILFVNPFKPSQIASAMLALEQEPKFYNELAKNGLKVTSRFSWEKTAKKMLELFQELKKAGESRKDRGLIIKIN